MEQKVIFRDDQELQAADNLNIELFTEQAIDHIVNDTIGTASKFWGFPVSQTSATEVNVGSGRVYYANGTVYYRDDVGGVSLNLFGSRPIANTKIISVVATPVTIETDEQARDFLINAETQETEPRVVTMETVRQCNIGFFPGQENATPQPPVVDPTNVVIAYVTMSPAGITAIDYVEANRMRSLQYAHERLDDFDDFRAKIGARVDTLASDIAALAAGQAGLAKQGMVNQIAFDVAQLKDKFGVPTNASSYDADHFLVTDKSDLTNAAYYANVDEGIRFPAIQAQVAQLALQNQYDSTVTVSNSYVFPTYTKNKRISVVGNDRSVPISQYPYQTIQMVQETRTQQVTRWGDSFLVCSNSSWWKSGRYDPRTGIFQRDGQTYNVVDTGLSYAPNSPKALQHEMLRLTQYWTDTVVDSYWDAVTVNQSFSGSIVAQTFLNSQAGYVCNINLFFAAVAAAGDVTLMLCKTLDNGAPDYTSAIAATTVLAADLQVYPKPTPFPMALPFLDKGDRYAIVLSTPGNHSIYQVNGNKYGQGSFFTCTDGVFSMGDPVYDMAFEAEFCSFNSARLEVAMQPLSLPGGIANVELNTNQTVPDGCSIVHRVKVNGQWVSMDSGTALTGLPALVEYQVVFVGTTDVMPCIGLGSLSQITTWRPANNFKHISTARILPSGVSTTSIKVQQRLEAWDAAHHTSTVKILYSTNYGTVQTYATMTQSVAVDDAKAILREYTFTMPGAVTSYKVQTEGTTDAVLTTFHVALRQDLSL